LGAATERLIVPRSILPIASRFRAVQKCARGSDRFDVNQGRPSAAELNYFNPQRALREPNMANTATKLPVKKEEEASKHLTMPQGFHPFETLRRETNRLLDDFDRDLWPAPFRRSSFYIEPLWRREWPWAATPAVDISESATGYEITAELPGLDEKSIEVKLANGNLMIKGEKQEEKEEKEKDYYLHERHFGSFQRCFRVPEGVDIDKIEATFKKGVLTVTLPKTPEAQKPEKKITVKAA
jgi:HSP20 family protein